MFMLECHIVTFPTGGVSRIEPASSRVNQTMYVLQQDDFDEQLEIFTVKDEWVSNVVVHDPDSAPSGLVADLNNTLSEQSRA